MDRETEIAAAADDLYETMARRCAELADQILGRPKVGTDAWKAEHATKDTPEGQAKIVEWHLLKIQIYRRARVNPIGDVVNARQRGASWQAIADVCGISRQAAFDRWSKYLKQKP